ncbi:MAG: response regulator [Acidimicrobiales bacterium]
MSTDVVSGDARPPNASPPLDAASIRVVVCDDHELFRRGLRMVLEAEDGIEVLAEAADGQQSLDLVGDLVPDVVVMDVRMPGMGGIEATGLIRRRFPTTRVIVLSVSDDEDDLYAAFRAGANGYLLKEVSIEEVADAVRSVAAGDSLLSPAVASRLLAEMDHPPLTGSEAGVLRRIALGDGLAEVAASLGIPVGTVRRHLGNVLGRLEPLTDSTH